MFVYVKYCSLAFLLPCFGNKEESWSKMYDEAFFPLKAKNHRNNAKSLPLKRILRHPFIFFCTGGLSYALFKSLLISKLFCTKGCMGFCTKPWGFWCGKSITRAIGRGKSWKFQLFWAQMALALLVTNSGPKKVLIFRANPFQWPLKWIFLHQNHYVSGHISNRY